MNNALKDLIEQAWNNRELLKDNAVQKAIRDVVDELDCGRLRIAEKGADGWHVNEWLKFRWRPLNAAPSNTTTRCP